MCLSRPQTSGKDSGRRNLHPDNDRSQNAIRDTRGGRRPTGMAYDSPGGISDNTNGRRGLSVRDLQLGRPTTRHLHPEISAFIDRLQDEIASQSRPPSLIETTVLELEREWDTGNKDIDTAETVLETEIQEDIVWEPNPPTLMVSHPPRITASTTKIQLLEGSLGQPCPNGPKRGRQSLMGPTTTKVASVARNDRRLLSDHTRGIDYAGTLIQDGLDHHKWDMEPPFMGPDSGNVDQNTSLM